MIRFPATCTARKYRAARLAAGSLLSLAAAVALCAGCQAPKYVKLRSTPRSPLVDRFQLTSWWGPQPTERTMQVLRQQDLLQYVPGSLDTAADELQKGVDEDISAEKLYALAELNYLAAKNAASSDENKALDRFGTAVACAYRYLFDERYNHFRNPYDPQFRGAVDLYNGALEESLRIVGRNEGLKPGKTHTIDSGGQRWDVQVVARGGRWKQDDFAHFEFVSDYEVEGLTNQFKTFGLGVPLIAVRKDADPAQARARYFPPDVSFPVTAFLRVLPDDPGAAATGRHRCLLELFDPLAACEIEVGHRRVPMESDLSTPLAYFLNNPALNQLATAGLLNPDRTAYAQGIYMLEPYTPGKIPVLMVHGLWSSPITWMEMFNDLRGIPEIRRNYQFWFYLYPTGQPFWTSAAQLREDLAQMRSMLDPRGREPALNQMVLVGHSMGGLLAKLQTVDSGDNFWQIVSDKNFEEVQLEPQVRANLARVFFFDANRSVRRVITIGTPHRGSNLANERTRWLAQRLISLPERTVETTQELLATGPDVIKEAEVLSIRTSIDSLSPSSPVFPVLLKSKPPEGIKYHNVVGVVPEDGWLFSVAGKSDGAVPYDSAHLDDVASEVVVSADHVNLHRHPRSVLEVQRILLEHLGNVRSGHFRPPPIDTACYAAPLIESQLLDQDTAARQASPVVGPALPGLVWEQPAPRASTRPGPSANSIRLIQDTAPLGRGR